MRPTPRLSLFLLLLVLSSLFFGCVTSQENNKVTLEKSENVINQLSEDDILSDQEAASLDELSVSDEDLDIPIPE